MSEKKKPMSKAKKGKNIPAKVEALPEKRKELTPAQQKLASEYWKRREERHDAPKLNVDHVPGEVLNVTPKERSATDFMELETALGTVDHDFMRRSLHQLLEAASFGGNTTKIESADVNGLLGAMHGIAPRDELEGMLAAQMVAVHTAAMVAMRQLKGSESIPQQDSNGSLAIKLMRTFTAQVEALNRYRGKGESQQRVVVEHVHVHEGGQAIVGAVSKTPEGEG